MTHVGWWNLAVRCMVHKSRQSLNLGSNLKSQGHRGQKNEKLLSHPHWHCMVRRRVRCIGRTLHAVANDSVVWLPGVTRWRQCMLAAACVRFRWERSLRAKLRRWENQRMLSSLNFSFYHISFSTEIILLFMGRLVLLGLGLVYVRYIRYTGVFFDGQSLGLCLYIRRILDRL